MTTQIDRLKNDVATIESGGRVTGRSSKWMLIREEARNCLLWHQGVAPYNIEEALKAFLQFLRAWPENEKMDWSLNEWNQRSEEADTWDEFRHRSVRVIFDDEVRDARGKPVEDYGTEPVEDRTDLQETE